MSGLGTGLGISLASITRLAASIPKEVEDIDISLDGILGLISTQSGDTLFTQDNENIYDMEQIVFITTQITGGRILTESGDFILTD